jgi:DNA polymerase alpha-associated DNA helicase A
MHKQICEFPSKTLYRSKLRSHSSVEAHLLKDLVEDDTEDPDEVLQHPVVLFDTAGCEFFERLESTSTSGSKDSDEGSRCNENEAMIVKQWVEKLVGVGIDPGQIAVITPYVSLIGALQHDSESSSSGIKRKSPCLRRSFGLCTALLSRLARSTACKGERKRLL